MKSYPKLYNINHSTEQIINEELWEIEYDLEQYIKGFNLNNQIQLDIYDRRLTIDLIQLQEEQIVDQQQNFRSDEQKMKQKRQKDNANIRMQTLRKFRKISNNYQQNLQKFHYDNIYQINQVKRRHMREINQLAQNALKKVQRNLTQVINDADQRFDKLISKVDIDKNQQLKILYKKEKINYKKLMLQNQQIKYFQKQIKEFSKGIKEESDAIIYQVQKKNQDCYIAKSNQSTQLIKLINQAQVENNIDLGELKQKVENLKQSILSEYKQIYRIIKQVQKRLKKLQKKVQFKNQNLQIKDPIQSQSFQLIRTMEQNVIGKLQEIKFLEDKQQRMKQSEKKERKQQVQKLKQDREAEKLAKKEERSKEKQQQKQQKKVLNIYFKDLYYYIPIVVIIVGFIYMLKENPKKRDQEIVSICKIENGFWQFTKSYFTQIFMFIVFGFLTIFITRIGKKTCNRITFLTILVICFFFSFYFVNNYKLIVSSKLQSINVKCIDFLDTQINDQLKETKILRNSTTYKKIKNNKKQLKEYLKRLIKIQQFPQLNLEIIVKNIGSFRQAQEFIQICQEQEYHLQEINNVYMCLFMFTDIYVNIMQEALENGKIKIENFCNQQYKNLSPSKSMYLIRENILYNRTKLYNTRAQNAYQKLCGSQNRRK